MANSFLSPIGNGEQFFTDSGVPLSGGLIYTYQAGTTTPVPVYSDTGLAFALPNPIVLNAAGRVPSTIWCDASKAYKFVLTDANNTTIQTFDSINSAGTFGSMALQNASNVAITGGSVTGLTGFSAAVSNIGATIDSTTTATGPLATLALTGTSGAQLDFKDKSQSLPDGLFRVTTTGNKVVGYKNTSIGGDYASATNVWSFDTQFNVNTALNLGTWKSLTAANSMDWGQYGVASGGSTMVVITGSTQINTAGSPPTAAVRYVYFSGSPLLKHATGGAGALWLGNNGADIQTMPGDIGHFVYNQGNGVWYLTNYFRTQRPSGVSYGGWVILSGGAITSNLLPAGWTANRTGAGQIVITHNLGTLNYAPTATSATAGSFAFTNLPLGANSFTISTTTSGSAADVNFTFTVTAA